jgi:hypothetical protein
VGVGVGVVVHAVLVEQQPQVSLAEDERPAMRRWANAARAGVTGQWRRSHTGRVPDQRGQDGPVRPVQSRLRVDAPKHRDLVTHHE